jgi:hypothetical protein
MMRRILETALFWMSALSLGIAQSPYEIRGTVIDDGGAAVPKALVRIDPLLSAPGSRVVRSVETDNEGRFSITDLEATNYKLFAMKEAQGYPNTAAAFYSNNIFPVVSLTRAVPTADVLLRVGPPAAILSGRVRDGTTGRKVVPGAFVMRRASDPDNWISLSESSDYRVLVPPDTEVFLEVMAAGYRTWYYGGPNDPQKREPLRLESRKEMKLDIRLAADERRKDPAQ